MKEKKVLIIQYYFPPLGMGGVQRIAKFAKYLPRYGWKPHILTVKQIEYLARDASLLKEVPAEVKVTRSGSFDPLRLWSVLKRAFSKKKASKKLLKAHTVGFSRILSWLFFPDNKLGWIPFALMKALYLCRRERFDLILTSSPPPSLHLTGYLLKLLTKTPWVADFRDPWAGYGFQTFPTPLHLFLKKKMEALILDHADRVITANLAIQRELTRHYPDAENILPVSQGYDEEDFAGYQPVHSDIFTIGYLGSLSPDCDPEPFFAALRVLIDQGKIPPEKVRFVFVGLPVALDLKRLIGRYQLSQVTEQRGYLSHADSLNQMSKASLLLLITSSDPLVFPAKVFEYLRLGKPILGIVPKEGELARFLDEMKSGKVVSPEDLEGIQKALLSYYSDHQKDEISLKVSVERIKEFERRHLTERLACIFEEIIKQTEGPFTS
jgi:hypothetical protein